MNTPAFPPSRVHGKTLRCRLIPVALLVAITMPGAVKAQQFTNINANLPGVNNSDLAWGDHDNDGDLDLVFAGYKSSEFSTITRIGRNNGGSFTEVVAGLPGVSNAALAWGDYDRDGDLDLALNGYSFSGALLQIRRNVGGGFSDINAGLPGRESAMLAWGDYDKDGDLDLAFGGNDGAAGPAQVRRNDGGVFTDIGASLPMACNGALAWGDYDNDGDLDLALAGHSASTDIAQIHRNDGGDVFTDAEAGLPGMKDCDLAWGDYDNDGDLDLVLAGATSGGFVTQVRRNDGGDVFTDITAGLPGLEKGAAAWGDYDNDGDLDLAIMGRLANNSRVAQIRRNDGGIFTSIGFSFPSGVYQGDLAWGDYDNDGNLDLALSGYTGSNDITQIWRNNAVTLNAPPAAPAGLAASMSGGIATLTWQASSDDSTPAAALTYNVRAGTTPGGSNIVAPHSIQSTGFRQVPEMGNGQLGLSLPLRGLPNGPIYWSVQPVDHGFRGGAFAAEHSFVAAAPPVAVTGIASDTTLTSATLSGSVDPRGLAAGYFFEWGTTTSYGSTSPVQNLPAGNVPVAVSTAITGLLPTTTYHFRLVATSAEGTAFGVDRTFSTSLFSRIGTSFPGLLASDLAWGDYDNDGDLDLVLSGSAGDIMFTQLWRNGGAGTFTDSAAALTGVELGDLAWSDYDRDGDLDLALTGDMQGGNPDFTQILRNDAGTFTDIDAGLPGLRFASAAWGDYDNDGDPDLAIAGSTAPGTTQIRRNDGGGVFTDVVAGLPAFYGGALAWGDYDNDGDLDLAQTGDTDGPNVTQIRRNDGGGMFTDIGAGLPGLHYATLAWGDYDSDGDLDLILAGSEIARMTQLRRNDGGGTFTNTGADLPALGDPALAWGDYDNDGDLDLALAGSIGATSVTQIRRNDGGGTFTDIGAGLPGVYIGELAWGDYDNDGDLDLAVTGSNGTLEITQLWRNNSATPNAPPTAPAGLAASTAGGVTTLSWQAASDAETSAAALTYNVRAGTTPGGSDVVSPEANPVTGLRRLPGMGNAQYGLSFQLGNIPNRTIYWSVQAVDTGFRGGAFASESTFLVAIPPVAVTGTAGNFLRDTATLTGSVNPQGLAGTYYFEWGSTASYGNATPVQALPAGNPSVNVSAVLSGLAASTTYHFRLVATTTAGTAQGADVAFTTPLFPNTGINLPGLTASAMAWGDYDSDDDLDFVIAGSASDGTPVTQLRRNDGGGVFTGFAAGLPVVRLAALAWGDYDNDGDLDLAIAGSTGPARIAQIRRNDGGGVFADSGAGLPGVENCALAWGDYDNDGDLDLAMSGDTGATYITQIHRNDGGFFTASTVGLPGTAGGALAWGDYDNDGDLDLALAGATGTSLVTLIYRNNGGGAFANIADLPGVDGAALAWGDYDNDGDLDLAMAGVAGLETYITQIRRNNGGFFSDIAAGLPGLPYASLAWGDYDHDGDLDLAMAGGISGGTQIRRNSGGVFTDIAEGLTGAADGALAWVDYDNDGDLDLAITGSNSTGGLTQIRRNGSNGANAPPTAPAGLNASVGIDDLRLSWLAASDAETPAAALTYNVRVGTTPGGSEIVSPHANVANGFRRLPDMGNGQLGLVLRLGTLPDSTIYWSVQAVDAGFRAGAFAPEQSGTFALPPIALTGAASDVTGATATLNGSVNPKGLDATFQFEWGDSLAFGNTTPAQTLPGGDVPVNVSAGITGMQPFVPYFFRLIATTPGGTSIGVPVTFTAAPFTDIAAGLPGLIYGAMAWGDYDNDGDLDLALAGGLDFTGSRNVTQIRRNDGGNSFTDIGAGLPGVWDCALAWGDYDNDGDLDLSLAGWDGANRIARIMRNDGATFNDIGAGLSGMQSCALAWGDYDEDGDLDLVLSGNGTTGPLTRLYRNDGGGVFSHVAANLPNLAHSALAWGDYDNDGDLDLALAGLFGNDHFTQIYRNNGGVFSNIATPALPAVTHGALAWGDFDNDGDPDLAIAGNIGPARITQIHRNDGGNSFTDIAAGLPGMEQGDLAWGDYDNDGDLDLALAGYDGAGPVTQLRRNDGGLFPNLAAGLPNVEWCALAWGDCDNDGDLDLALAGYTGNSIVTQLKLNGVPTPNVPPLAPADLAASPSGTTATFSWQPASDTQTPAAALTCNLRVGTTPGGSNILGPQANAANGYRRLPAPGNAQSGLNFKLKNLPNGIYYWSVQAVDTAFQGGPFAGTAVFAAGSTLTVRQLWRFPYFGTIENDGTAADLADPDGDGAANLMEFATLGNPLVPAPFVPVVARNGSDITLTYPRAKAAADHVAFAVEWSDAPATSPWSTAGVSETILTEDATLQTIRATVAAGPGPRRFVRLRVTAL